MVKATQRLQPFAPTKITKAGYPQTSQLLRFIFTKRLLLIEFLENEQHLYGGQAWLRLKNNDFPSFQRFLYGTKLIHLGDFMGNGAHVWSPSEYCASFN